MSTDSFKSIMGTPVAYRFPNTRAVWDAIKLMWPTLLAFDQSLEVVVTMLGKERFPHDVQFDPANLHPANLSTLPPALRRWNQPLGVMYGHLLDLFGLLKIVIDAIDEATDELNGTETIPERLLSVRAHRAFTDVVKSLHVVRQDMEQPDAHLFSDLQSFRNCAIGVKEPQAMIEAMSRVRDPKPSLGPRVQPPLPSGEPDHVAAEVITASTTTDSKPVPIPQVDPFVFKRDGANWQIRFKGKGGSFPHRVGFDHISSLLRNTEIDRGISILALLGCDEQKLGSNRSTENKMDPEAQNAYSKEATRLSSEREKALRGGDDKTVKRLDREMTLLTEEIKSGKGRQRFAGSRTPSGKAKHRFVESLRFAYKTLHGRTAESGVPELVAHFKESIVLSKGTAAYSPRGNRPDWQT